MLVLSRRVNEAIRIGADVVVTVVEVCPRKGVVLAIDAPQGMTVRPAGRADRSAAKPEEAN